MCLCAHVYLSAPSICCQAKPASMAQSDAHPAGDQGPVVRSIVSLTSSLRVISLTVLAESIHNILIFFAEKMLLTFFQQKFSAYLCITQCKF